MKYREMELGEKLFYGRLSYEKWGLVNLSESNKGRETLFFFLFNFKD